jgi:hypothetical protein
VAAGVTFQNIALTSARDPTTLQRCIKELLRNLNRTLTMGKGEQQLLKMDKKDVCIFMDGFNN